MKEPRSLPNINPNAQYLVKDSHYLHKQLQPRNFSRLTSSRQQQILAQAKASLTKVEARRASVPELKYPDLPVSSQREKILAALSQHQVIVVAGETGSGKTTQLPKICLEAGLGARGLIGHTQPRRLAARSVATRLAEEMQVELGAQVGFQVRFQDSSSPNSLVKVMTDGILLAEIQQDPYLNRYEVLIIDEAHERSLNIDFLLGYLKRLLPKRPDLKLIITSATLDTASFSKHFNDCPCIEVAGRSFPVTIEYQPLAELEAQQAENSLLQGLAQALHRVEEAEKEFGWRSGPQDVLVFLATEAQIRTAMRYLRASQNSGNFRGCQLIPLYARLPASEQQKVFHPKTNLRRIILATNVAETSLTVPGIRYVIDAGLARVKRFSTRVGIERLPIEAVSQASANQRAGRCGRLAPGLCIRLFSAEDFAGRAEFTQPEILRSNLAAVILQMLNLNLGDFNDFPFLAAPENASVKAGLRLLFELGAVNTRQGLTKLGRQLARLPLDPRLARMLLAASDKNCLQEMLVLVAALSLQDPRERPPEQQAAADQAHAQWADKTSDFASLINLWRTYEEQRLALTNNQLRAYCSKNFLSWLRMREWRTTHSQLKILAKQLKLKFNSQPADYNQLHQALLAGLLSNLGMQQENKEFLGCYNRKFFVHPSSELAKKPPKWIMAAEMVATSRLFGRLVARVEPEWAEPLAQHLTKTSYSQPHWHKKAAQVSAYAKISLFGLPLISQRRVDYSRIEPELCRDIFIRSGLVEGEYTSRGKFAAHNQQLLSSLQELEDKARKRDIVVDDELIYAFYASKIPPQICKGIDFENWRKEAEAENPRLLFLTAEELLARSADEVTQEDFPNQLHWQGISWPLTYSFAPGQKDDGVNLHAPVAMLQQLPKERLEWLVPGFLEEKIICLMRNLPKNLRKNFVPLPDFAKQALNNLQPSSQPLSQALAAYLSRIARLEISAEDLRPTDLEPHLLVNIRVLDPKGRLLSQGRNLSALQQEFAQESQSATQNLAGQDLEITAATSWNFAALPSVISQQLNGQQSNNSQQPAGVELKAFPALIDEGASVGAGVFNSQKQAQASHRQGLLRLIRLQLAATEKYLIKEINQRRQLALSFAKLGTKQELIESLLNAGLSKAFFQEEAASWPRSAEEFKQFVQNNKAAWVPLTTELIEQAEAALRLYAPLAAAIKKQVTLANALNMQSLEQHLKRLFHKDFINWAGERLADYPRYLQALEIRLEKLLRNPRQDLVWAQEIAALEEKWQAQYLKLQQEKELASAEFINFYWLIEEYRVSLFAQQLGTSQPVSAKRLAAAWQELGF